MAGQRKAALKSYPEMVLDAEQARARGKRIIRRWVRLNRNKYIKPAKDQLKPNLDDRLFWDVNLDEINWRRASRFVVERILQRGRDKEYEEIARFYGREKIIRILTRERCSVWNMRMDEVTAYFGLRKEELSCYRRRQIYGYNWL